MEDKILRHPAGHEVPVPGWLVNDKLAEGYEVVRPTKTPSELTEEPKKPTKKG